MHPRKLFFLLISALVILVACNLPQATTALPPTAPPNAQTLAARTLQAIVSATAAAPAPSSPVPPTSPPTLPPTVTLTPTPTLTPTATLTPTPAAPHISVSVDTNCRTGPGDAYPRVGGLLVGQTAEVLARDPSGLFWYIPNPQRPGQSCWVWGQYATITGDTSRLPVFTPPPTPTPLPNFTIQSVTMKNCCGPDYFIKIVNTGGTTWQSYSLSVDDLTAGIHATAAKNAFAPSTSVCGPTLSVPEIAPGHSAYISYYPGWGNASHHMRFTVTLYTQDGQSGYQVTRTAEYRP